MLHMNDRKLILRVIRIKCFGMIFIVALSNFFVMLVKNQETF